MYESELCPLVRALREGFASSNQRLVAEDNDSKITPRARGASSQTSVAFSAALRRSDQLGRDEISRSRVAARTALVSAPRRPYVRGMTEPPEELIGIYRVVGLTGIGPTRLAMLMRAGLFPPRLEGSRGRWRKSEVESWVKTHPPQVEGATRQRKSVRERKRRKAD